MQASEIANKFDFNSFSNFSLEILPVLISSNFGKSSARVFLRIKQRSSGFALGGSCYVCPQFFLQFRANINGARVPALGLISV